MQIYNVLLLFIKIIDNCSSVDAVVRKGVGNTQLAIVYTKRVISALFGERDSSFVNKKFLLLYGAL